MIDLTPIQLLSCADYAITVDRIAGTTCPRDNLYSRRSAGTLLLWSYRDAIAGLTTRRPFEFLIRYIAAFRLSSIICYGSNGQGSCKGVISTTLRLARVAATCRLNRAERTRSPPFVGR